MSHLPTEVHVGPYRINVTIDATHLDNERGRDELAGLCQIHLQRITLRDTLAADYAAEVLLHEILHATITTIGQPLEGAREERLVNALAPTLLQALRSPGLAAYLLDPEAT